MGSERNADRISLPDAPVDRSSSVVLARSQSRRRVCGCSSAETSGVFIFVEQGLSPDAGVMKWQNRLTPLWRLFAGGCHLNRKVDDLVRDAGFTIADLRTEYVPGPRALTFMYEGCAKKN